jgi:hypothetical protein
MKRFQKLTVVTPRWATTIFGDEKVALANYFQRFPGPTSG